MQLDSGSGFDYISSNHFYKVKHISLIEIKNHLLNEYFYRFFFTFFSAKEVFAWNNKLTQVKNYNQYFLVNFNYLDRKFFYNDCEKLLLLKFHEYGHTKFKNNLANNIAHRYLFDNHLEIVDNQKNMDKII